MKQRKSELTTAQALKLVKKYNYNIKLVEIQNNWLPLISEPKRRYRLILITPEETFELTELIYVKLRGELWWSEHREQFKEPKETVEWISNREYNRIHTYSLD